MLVLPTVCQPIKCSRRAHGRLKWLVSYCAGPLAHINLGEVTHMQSYFGHQTFYEPAGAGEDSSGSSGSNVIKKTTNCFSWAGNHVTHISCVSPNNVYAMGGLA